MVDYPKAPYYAGESSGLFSIKDMGFCWIIIVGLVVFTSKQLSWSTDGCQRTIFHFNVICDYLSFQTAPLVMANLVVCMTSSGDPISKSLKFQFGNWILTSNDSPFSHSFPERKRGHDSSFRFCWYPLLNFLSKILFPRYRIFIL